MPSSAPAPTLPQLQNLMKRDPDGYADEYAQRLRHFRSSLQLLEQKPSSSDGKELLPLLSFMSHVTPCYPTAGAGVAEELAALLERHHDLLDPALRRALVQALILLRNRGMFGAEPLLRLCFRLFRCRDKALRERLRHHIVADVKAVNLKRKDLALNRALQTCAAAAAPRNSLGAQFPPRSSDTSSSSSCRTVVGMLGDASATAARCSLSVMIELYRRHVWHDAKTVNHVASALSSTHAKLRVAALHFMLGEAEDENVDDDEDDAVKDAKAAESDLRGDLGRNGVATKTLLKKKQRKLKRAEKASKKAVDAQKTAAASFAAIELLHDPQATAERLLSDVRQSKERWEVRLGTRLGRMAPHIHA